MDNKPVLVVEDDEEIRRSLGEVLVDHGYEVMLAANGIEALRELDRRRPHIILLDLMMPIMDGWELSAELRRRGGDSAEIAIVVLTADTQVRDKAAAVGARAFLRKPIRVEDLLEILESL